MKLQSTIYLGDTFTIIENGSKPYVLEHIVTSDDLKNLVSGWTQSGLAALLAGDKFWVQLRRSVRLDRLLALRQARRAGLVSPLVPEHPHLALQH